MLAMTGILDFLIFWTCAMRFNDIAGFFRNLSRFKVVNNEDKSNAVSYSASHTRKSPSMESVARCSGLFITAPVGGLACQLQAGRPPGMQYRTAVVLCANALLPGKPGKRRVPHLAPRLTREIASTTITAQKYFIQSIHVCRSFVLQMKL